MGQRQLAVIMFTDFVGYSALAERNEPLALELLEKHWALLRSVFTKFDGHEIKTIGDAFLIEFPSALQAVEAGLAIQRTLDEYNDSVDEDHKIQIRIGIHLGDVERRENDVFGDGVNIASRIEPLAAPGGICISEPVYTSVRNKVDVPFYSMGEQKLKNISQPIVVYSNRPDQKAKMNKSNRRSVIAGAAKGAVVVLLVLVLFAWIKEEPPSTVTSTTQTKTLESEESAVVSERKSVAVLPFANRSKSEDDAYFVDGIHDDILTQLAKIASLKVISRTSVMGYRDTTKNMKTIGDELGVATLLEGSVQRAGNRVRINVQLIDAGTDVHLWAETYDRELTVANIFDIQEQIATEIANALRATLLPEEQARLKAVPTKNLDALEAYFLGKQRMVERTSKGLTEAVDYFQQAIALDPDFALAYVGLADSYQLQIAYSGLPKDEMHEKAEIAINKALALDDKSGEANASLALLKMNRRDLAGAEIAFQHALVLNPNYAAAYNWYAGLMGEQGRHEEALALYRKGAELDPLSVVLNINIAWQLAALGRFDEVLAQHEKTIDVGPAAPWGYLGKASFYWLVSGQLDEAVPWFRKAYSLDADNPQINVGFAYLFWALGDDREAECWANRAMELAPESFIANDAMQLLYLQRGEEAEALAYARKAWKIQSDWTKPRSLASLRNHDLRSGRYTEARARYEKSFPELLAENKAKIDGRNFRAAIDLAAVLKRTGEQERVDWLLNGNLKYIQSIQRLGVNGYGISDVQIYALQGETQKALTALRQAIDGGWRGFWRYDLEYNLNLESIQNEPEFQAMLAEIKVDMAEQLARVNAMEKESDICVGS